MCKKPLFFLFGLFIASFLTASAQSNPDFISISSGVKYQYMGSYDVNRLNSILTKDADAFSEYKLDYAPARYPVKLYRVIYNSVIPEKNNKPTIASGLIAIPDNGKNNMPVVSYQHGTVFGKTDVPYYPEQSSETRLMVANFASQGYIFISADNFGKAISTEPDAYQLKESTQQADLDMLLASKEVLKALKIQDGPLFLSGWSMGSWSTLLFLQKLESLNIPVKAAAVACNPTDIFALINRWIHNPNAIDAVWLPGIMAVQLNSYAQYYDLPGLAESGIKPEYQKASLDYYQNKITYNQFYAITPHKLADFLKPEFMEASSLGVGRYWGLLEFNNSYRWRSKTIINCYYGEVDEAIPMYIGTLPLGYQELVGGAKVNVISAGSKGDHRGTFKFAIKDQKKWFDSLLQ
ncbi:hypothetical protein [Mucilaginibacter phyllosphaerae]